MVWPKLSLILVSEVTKTWWFQLITNEKELVCEYTKNACWKETEEPENKTLVIRFRLAKSSLLFLVHAACIKVQFCWEGVLLTPVPTPAERWRNWPTSVELSRLWPPAKMPISTTPLVTTMSVTGISINDQSTDILHARSETVTRGQDTGNSLQLNWPSDAVWYGLLW